jgi:hypothetical protein
MDQPSPIEFARQSDNGRMVITPGAPDVTVLWAMLAASGIEDAMPSLRCGKELAQETPRKPLVIGLMLGRPLNRKRDLSGNGQKGAGLMVSFGPLCERGFLGNTGDLALRSVVGVDRQG